MASFSRLGVVVCLLFTGCAGVSTLLTGTSGPRNEGYALLDQLLSNEANVSKLLIVKEASPETTTLIKKISATAVARKAMLEAFAQQDSNLVLTHTGLPSAEVRTRAAVAATMTKELLENSGADFELHLLLTQEEAMSYGANLADVLAKDELVAARKQFLMDTAHQCRQLRQEVLGRLSVR